MTATLILGAAVWADGPSPTLRRRTLHAAALWQAGIATHLVACGGIGRHPPSEAQAMARLLREAGIPEAAISLEERSTTTIENIRFALPILDRLGTREVLIVTDLPHAPRARLAARRLGLRATSSSPPLGGASRKQLLRTALREGPAYLAYWWRLRDEPRD